jgi:hypothetical protein
MEMDFIIAQTRGAFQDRESKIAFPESAVRPGEAKAGKMRHPPRPDETKQLRERKPQIALRLFV